jgi:two-component system, chemotaxis family, sensor kinase CheA
MAGGRGRISKKALQEFLSEAQEIVEQLGSDLLRLEDQGKRGRTDPDVVNATFRAAHSLKGLSGMFGVDRMHGLAHHLEDLLDGMRMGRVALDAAILDVLFECVETLNLVIAEVDKGDDGEGTSKERSEDLVRRIEGILSAESGDGAEDPIGSLEIDGGVLAVLTEYEEHRLRENVRQGADLYWARASFDLMTFDRDLAELSDKLKELGEVISTLPSGEGGSETAIDFDLLIGTERAQDEIGRAVEGFQVTVTAIGRKGGVAPPREVAEAAPKRRPAQVGAVSVALDDDPEVADAEEAARTATAREEYASLKSVAQTVRVDIRKLDALMTIVGELVLSKTNLQRISDGLKDKLGFTGIAVELYKESRNLERRLEELQQGVLEVRMVPLGQIFDKLSRMVRKMAREEDKEIRFEVSGGDTELDKLIIEDLSDPLMHMIRNAIDHGIETREIREARGKPPEGTLRLHAQQRGNHVTIEVSDDGAGMDEQAILDKALERGLVTSAQAMELSRRDILNLIFVPGFSTRAAVSDLSGRGVGMDVVKTNIAGLSGVIDVRSERGKGSTFAVTLPITLAIIQALVIRAAGRVYAVPLSSVLEILRVDAGEIRTVERQEVIDLRGATVPLVRLSRLFGIDKEDAEAGTRRGDREFVVIVGLAESRIGVAVDALLGQQDVVIKSLGRRLGGVRGIAGATDLGDQRTTLVLDVAALIEEVLDGGDAEALAG